MEVFFSDQASKWQDLKNTAVSASRGRRKLPATYSCTVNYVSTVWWHLAAVRITTAHNVGKRRVKGRSKQSQTEKRRGSVRKKQMISQKPVFYMNNYNTVGYVPSVMKSSSDNCLFFLCFLNRFSDKLV